LSKNPVWYHCKSEFDVHDEDAEEEDRECEDGGKAGENCERDGKEEEEWDDDAINWVYDSHSLWICGND
tara:strand:+ start:95 stop:301 length:207 start_codon:yes stop_codon:yes gene_type:complete